MCAQKMTDFYPIPFDEPMGCVCDHGGPETIDWCMKCPYAARHRTAAEADYKVRQRAEHRRNTIDAQRCAQKYYDWSTDSPPDHVEMRDPKEWRLTMQKNAASEYAYAREQMGCGNE
jgi:hypothetical protein